MIGQLLSEIHEPLPIHHRRTLRRLRVRLHDIRVVPLLWRREEQDHRFDRLRHEREKVFVEPQDVVQAVSRRVQPQRRCERVERLGVRLEGNACSPFAGHCWISCVSVVQSRARSTRGLLHLCGSGAVALSILGHSDYPTPWHTFPTISSLKYLQTGSKLKLKIRPQGNHARRVSTLRISS
jgi:hypothetical protein